jgi:manganese/iron transport system permease protein/iron/zinc/copper transport system permease protein
MLTSLYQLIIEPLTQQVFQRALLAGCLVAIVCAVIGCYVILRRMAFLGDAVAHAMLAGVTAGYLFMKIVFDQETHVAAMLIGSLLAGMVTVVMVNFVSRISRIKEDTAIGIMYTGIFALGGLLASYFADTIHVDLYHFVIGQSVLTVRDSEIWLIAIVAAVVLAVAILFARQLRITSFDPVMAASLGISVMLYQYVLTACTSLVVVSGVQLVGVILVVGMLVTPAATAYLIADRLSRMQVLAALFGVSSIVGGLYLSTWIGNAATGPMIVFFSTLQFLIVLVVAPRYGILADWMRRRAMVPQQLVEDVLGCLRKSGDTSVTMATFNKYVEATPKEIHKALRWLDRRELVSAASGIYQLTEAGQQEARSLLRAHRLWESYLKHVGLPADELHQQAHLLEHLHDEETVDYLDDKLGHPLRDPHGAEIPEDFVHLVPGEVVKLALLRDGHSGTIERIEGKLTGPRLVVGGHIVMGPRKEEGKIWSMRLADGRWIEIDHLAADAIMVRLDEHGAVSPTKSPSRPLDA